MCMTRAHACTHSIVPASEPRRPRQTWRKAIKNDVKPPNNSFAQNDVGGGKCIYDVAMNYRKMLLNIGGCSEASETAMNYRRQL